MQIKSAYLYINVICFSFIQQNRTVRKQHYNWIKPDKWLQIRSNNYKARWVFSYLFIHTSAASHEAIWTTKMCLVCKICKVHVQVVIFNKDGRRWGIESNWFEYFCIIRSCNSSLNLWISFKGAWSRDFGQV